MADEQPAGLGTEIVDAPAEVAAVTDAPPPAETAETAAPTTPAEKAAKLAEEHFIDPSTLPDEIKPHWKRMHGAYNKRLEEIRAGKQDIEFLAKFRSDPEFARTVLQAEARRFGYDLAAPNGADKPATTRPQQQGGDAPPPDMIERIRSRLAPELQWMAEDHAKAAWEARRITDEPKEQQARARQQADLIAAFNDQAEKLTAAAPGWEEHESDMNELLGFLKSPALTHPKFGAKLDLLYRAVAPSNGRARVEAIRAQAEAARNASRTGQPGRSTVTNIPDRVRKASTTREAMAIAVEEAEREVRANGGAVPD
jgi:hypothetical protein